MNFEDLKYFFNNEESIKIKTAKPIDAEYIQIHSINSETVIFSNFKEDEDEEEENKQYYEGYITENDAIRQRNATDKSFDYFAKIICEESESIIVSIISFKKMRLNEDLCVGIGDLDEPFNATLKNIEDNYILNICDRQFYIYGLHKNANGNMFSIMSTSLKYDVVLSRREECGAVLNREMANDQIWAIKRKEFKYKKEDYTFQVRELNLDFEDVSSAAAATEQNKLEMKNLDESSILGRWVKFAEEDYTVSKEKIDSVSHLKYNSYVHKDGDKHIFTIDCDKEKYEAFKKLANELGNDLTFTVYTIDEIDKVMNDEKLSRRLFAKPKLVDVVGNKIICFYDGDVIIGSSGYLTISNRGSEVVYKRRMDAVNRIKNDGAAKPNIMQLIEGKPIYSKQTKKTYRVENFMKEIVTAFGGRVPNKSQLDAIEIAINTPDFAIIQGPPGCGKTSLINAIDDCLAKIDSTYHKKAASLSTAYQRESTKNMVSKKIINGVPVPFISKGSDRVFIENNFMEYIENIAEKLKNKYPELIGKIDEKSNFDTITAYASRFNYENASFESLSFFIENILDCLTDSTLFEEKEKLVEIQKIAKKKIENILNPSNDESLYFIRIIPGSSTEFEDDGLRTFLIAKVNLEILNPSFTSLLDRIEKEFKASSINFQLINTIKNDMIFHVKNAKQINKDIVLNKKAIDIVYKIKDYYAEEATHDNERVLVQYIDSFINNPVRVRQALEQWITSVAATHQISSDNSAIGQLVDEDSASNYVVYNNVLIDEAARSCPPDLLIPISCAKNRIILVGDHKQLPQFVNDEVLERIDLEDEIKNNMKDVSMFEYLIDTTKKLEKNDSFVRFIALNQQYRMPKVLGDFIGENFYPEIGIGSPRGNPCDDEGFVQTMPYIENKCMVWCDVPYGKESNKNIKGYKNIEEAVTVAKMLNAFLGDENNSNLKIGVISFYKDQVREIIEQLINYNIYIKNDNGTVINDTYKNRLQIDTVDAFQGLECDIVILSMVRSNPYNKFKRGSFGFLKDERHLCVALSRQKRCLIVVGNGSGMLQTANAESSVRALANYYKKCKEGGKYVGFIESKDII